MHLIQQFALAQWVLAKRSTLGEIFHNNTTSFYYLVSAAQVVNVKLRDSPAVSPKVPHKKKDSVTDSPQLPQKKQDPVTDSPQLPRRKDESNNNTGIINRESRHLRVCHEHLLGWIPAD